MTAESAAIVSMVLEVRPEHIAMLKAVLESYDNLATIRTADPMRHHLKLWFSPEHHLPDPPHLLTQISIRRNTTLRFPGGWRGYGRLIATSKSLPSH
jgi:hypothetical protein